MSKYDSLKHAKFRLRYHIIFSTKYRKKLLEPITEDILSYMKTAETKDFSILIEETDKDHIHLLIKATPYITLAEIVKRLKQQSTYYVWKNHHTYMSKWYWSGKHYLWTRGYFVSTIGEVSEKKIKQYIENQG
jgi:putative transposase